MIKGVKFVKKNPYLQIKKNSAYIPLTSRLHPPPIPLVNTQRPHESDLVGL